MLTQGKILLAVLLVSTIAILWALRSADKAKLETADLKVAIVENANKEFSKAEKRNLEVATAVKHSVETAIATKKESIRKVNELAREKPENDFLNQIISDDIIDVFNAGLLVESNSSGTGKDSN